jgi:hypothetical protein
MTWGQTKNDSKLRRKIINLLKQRVYTLSLDDKHPNEIRQAKKELTILQRNKYFSKFYEIKTD